MKSEQKRLIAFLALIILAAGAYFGPEWIKIHKAKEAVKLRLKDPSSAEFRDINIGILGTICGYVNAHNSFGAYNGYQRFVSGGSGVLLEEYEQSKEFEAFWDSCNPDLK